MAKPSVGRILAYFFCSFSVLFLCLRLFIFLFFVFVFVAVAFPEAGDRVLGRTRTARLVTDGRTTIDPTLKISPQGLADRRAPASSGHD